jgi:hypothetical protein
MISLPNDPTWVRMAVAKGAHKLQGLWWLVCIRRRVADEEQTEPGTNLGEMQSTGVRNRRAPEQSPGGVNDLHDSPAASPTNSTASGTLTPCTSDGVLESPGRGGVQEFLDTSQLTQVLPESRLIRQISLATSFRSARLALSNE